MEITTNLVVVILLLAANGFFVAAEFALVKGRGFPIEALADYGGASASLINRIHQNLEAYLSVCQSGITMASLGLGWVGQATVAAMLEPVLGWADLPQQTMHAVAFLTGFLFLSSLHIVVGGQIPKTLAIHRPEPIARAVAYPLHWTYLLVYPLNWLLSRASRVILRGFEVEEATHAEVFTDGELKGLVETSCELGEFDHDKSRMLHKLFEFDQREVASIMVPFGRMHVLDIGRPSADNLNIIRETGHSHFPLIDSVNDNAIKGIVLVKDIYAAMLDGDKKPWADLTLLSRDPLIVPLSQQVAELFDLIRTKRGDMAFVVDEYGDLVGLVTLEDLLQEIVGEFQTKTDDKADGAEVQKVGENLWEADGLTSLSDLERVTGYSVPADLKAKTLSGLFMRKLSRMPKVGDQIEDCSFVMIVLSLSERRIGRASIENRIVSGGKADMEEAPQNH